MSRILDAVVPRDSYVTSALRHRWEPHRTVATHIVQELRRESPAIPAFAVRLTAWCDDEATAARDERESAAARLIRKHEALFDSIEREPLTGTQRRAVVSAERRVGVNAGAGCGKTGTIIARAAFRIAAGLREPTEVIALTFTRKAAKEMRERFEAAAINEVTASTYHSLAKRIAFRARGRRKILKLDKKQEEEAVRLIIGDLVRDPSDVRAAEFIMANLFPSFVKNANSERSPRGYLDYLRAFRVGSLDGKAARSSTEAALVNMLLVADLPYRSRPRVGRYRPTVLLTDGSNRSFDVRIVEGSRESPIVPRSFQGKGDEGVTVLAVPLESDGIDIRALRRTLGLNTALTTDEIARLPQLRGYAEAIDRVTKLVIDFMRRFRASGMSLDELGRLGNGTRTSAFITLYEMVEMVAAAMLERAGYIDFDGVVREATSVLEAGEYRARWRDLILDEYQDVSEREIRFLEALARAHDAEIFAVGDDWQAIYGFKGSAWDALQTFGRRFGGGDDIELYEYPETHRSVDAIHEPAGRFVRKNPGQTQKQLRSTRSPAGEPRIEIRGVTSQWDDFVTQGLARDTLSRLAKAPTAPRDVLILARAGTHLLEPSGTIGQTSFLSMTIHGAKGLGADAVIITDAFASFPGRRIPDPLLALVQRHETFPDAEERRVFYVALTRARDRVIVLTHWNRRSAFLEEFRRDRNVVFIDEPAKEMAAQTEDIPCPECRCGFSLLSKNASHICTNYPFCDYVFPQCSCGHPVILNSGVARCNGCRRELWPCDECGHGIMELRPGRTAARCSNYSFSNKMSCQAMKYLNQLTPTERRQLVVRH